MVLYTCNRCNKNFYQKSNYVFHINRKYPCKKINIIKDVNNNNINKNNKLFNDHTKIIEPKRTQNEPKMNLKKYRCNYCNNLFTTNSHLRRHEKNNCKILKEQKKLNKKIIKLEIENKKLTKQITKINNINNNTINSNNKIINNNIKLVKFGDEDLNKISDKVYKMILNKGFQSVPELIKQIHFNNNIPENHNMYISNSRSNDINIYDGDKFVLIDQIDIIDSLYDEKTGHLEEKYENYNDLPNSTKKKFNRFLNNKDDEKHKLILFKTIKRLLYNNRTIPIETRKKIEK